MNRILTCSIREIVQHGGLVPGTFEEALEHIHRPGGFWQVIERDKLTGRILREQWLENNWTDNAISQIYDAILRASAPTQFTPANIMVISATLGMTTLTASIPSGSAPTSITVAAPTGATIPSGTKIVIDPGAGHQNISATLSAAISGAGTVSITGAGTPSATIPSGSSVRYDYTAVPTADPSSIASPVSYTSAMASGQFVKTITTGYGNRRIDVTNNSAYLFSTTGSPAATAGSYTEAWMTNTNPISATNQTVLRCALDNILTINSTTIGQVNITEKL